MRYQYNRIFSNITWPEWPAEAGPAPTARDLRASMTTAERRILRQMIYNDAALVRAVSTSAIGPRTLERAADIVLTARLNAETAPLRLRAIAHQAIIDSARREATGIVALARQEETRINNALARRSGEREARCYWPGLWTCGMPRDNGPTPVYLNIPLSVRVTHVQWQDQTAPLAFPFTWRTVFLLRVTDSAGHYDMAESGTREYHPHSGPDRGTCASFARRVPETVRDPVDLAALTRELKDVLSGCNYDSLLVRPREWHRQLRRMIPVPEQHVRDYMDRPWTTAERLAWNVLSFEPNATVTNVNERGENEPRETLADALGTPPVETITLAPTHTTLVNWAATPPTFTDATLALAAAEATRRRIAERITARRTARLAQQQRHDAEAQAIAATNALGGTPNADIPF